MNIGLHRALRRLARHVQHQHVYERLKPVIEIVRRVAGHDQRQRADDVRHEATRRRG